MLLTADVVVNVVVEIAVAVVLAVVVVVVVTLALVVVGMVAVAVRLILYGYEISVNIFLLSIFGTAPLFSFNVLLTPVMLTTWPISSLTQGSLHTPDLTGPHSL